MVVSSLVGELAKMSGGPHKDAGNPEYDVLQGVPKMLDVNV